MIRMLMAVACLGFACLLSSCTSGPEASAGTWINPRDGMRFVWVPAGSFTADVPVESEDPNRAGEFAARPYEVAGFWVGRTEVTVGQFRRFVKEAGYVTDAEKADSRWTWKNPGFPQRADHPVVYLSYHDARQYARWAGVDLPMEAEWLYACRAGTDTTFHWGDEFDGRYVWHRGNTDGTGTRPVARKLPNTWGLHDTVGNAREYCRVGLAPPKTESRSGGASPTLPTTHAADDALRASEGCFVTRGGSWVRCPDYRGRTGGLFEKLFNGEVEPRLQRYDPNPKYPPYPWDDDRGFRCVRRASP